MRGPTPTSSIPNTPRLPGITQMDLGGGKLPTVCMQQLCTCNPKCPPFVACSQCNNAYMYMYLPPNHLMVLCVVFFSRTLLCLKKNDFWNLLLLSRCELCVGRAIMHYWKFSQVELLGFFFRLIAYNIRTIFIFTCAGFLKRHFGSFVCFPYFVWKVNEDD